MNRSDFENFDCGCNKKAFFGGKRGRNLRNPDSMAAAPFNREGFTLIEVLAVVAIIGILTSLVLPAVAKGRAASRGAQCKSNLRQMSLALEMYLDDSSGFFPTYEWSAAERRFNWEVAVQEYLGSSSAAAARMPLHCPSGRLGVMHETVPGAVFSLNASPTYGYNSFGYLRSGPVKDSGVPAGLGGYLGTGAANPTRQSQLKNTADMLALGDGFRRKAGRTPKLEESFYLGRVPNIGFASPGEWKSNIAREEDLAERRHQGRLNMAFTDGHVESAKIEQWYFSDAEPDIRRWRTDNQAE